MNQQRNVIIGVISLVVIVGLIFWLASRSSPVPENTSLISQENNVGEDSQPVIQSHRSYHIESNAADTAFQPDQSANYTFSIVDERGDVKKDFATVHEKIMHVIAVRKDLQEFQHVHPTFDEQTGVFTLADLTFPSDGPYRIFADFTPMGTQLDPSGQPLGVTIYEDVIAGSMAKYSPQQLGAATSSSSVNGYTVSLTKQPDQPTSGMMKMLSFTVSREGQPVTNLQSYLGALGHAVVLREGDLQFIHAHPIEEATATQNGAVQFHVNFPESGNYKVFAQFQHQGQVFTSEFVVPVAAGSSMMDMQDMMPMMDHSQH